VLHLLEKNEKKPLPFKYIKLTGKIKQEVTAQFLKKFWKELC
jgi:hypothetical protein